MTLTIVTVLKERVRRLQIVQAVQIIVIPEERVRLLQVFNAVQTNSESLTTIRVKRKRIQVLRISRRAQSTRQHSPAAIPMPSSVLSGLATGEEASFPSSTYLRKRYRKLQRCKVSHHMGSGEQTPKDGSDDLHDPSFDAIRALNGQPDTKSDPVVVPAIINNVNSTGAAKMKPSFFPPGGRLPHRSTSDQYAPQSFSARVDRLTEAPYGIDGGLHIRIASSDWGARMGVSARTAIASNTASGSWVTEESTVDCENFGRMAGHRPRGPFPTASLSTGSFPHRDSDIQRIDTENTIRRSGSLLISEDQWQQLEGRIQGEIARSANIDRRDSLETAIHVKRPKNVDPRVVRLQGRDGIEKHNISPIPLHYHRRRGLATPSISSSGTHSNLSSPLAYVLARQATRVKTPTPSIRSQRSAEAIAGGNSWFPGIAFAEENSLQGVKHQPKKGKENQGERQEKNSRIIRWVNHVKEAFGYRKDQPAKKYGKTIGVFKDQPFDASDNWAEMPITHPKNTLRDITNIRHPAYLKNNSFAQDKHMRQKTNLAPPVRTRARPQQRAIPVHPPASSPLKQFELKSRPTAPAALARARTALRGHVITDSPPLTRNMSWGASRASTAKPIRTEEELHPNVAFALARLEGRAAPPPLSPIRRWRDDSDTYGADVEVELGRLRLDAPAPLVPYLYGAWTERFEEAVDAGFDCAMEAPLSPGTRRYLDSLV
ncbi:MAG: hypothetical protein Q9184_002231 [Pyrenodesmia sp. 2 TL-2023]